MSRRLRGIRLTTINRLLGFAGLVLVVAIDPDQKVPTRFWIQRVRTF